MTKKKRNNPLTVALFLGIVLVALFALLGEPRDEALNVNLNPDGTPFLGPTSAPPESDLPPFNFAPDEQ